MRRVSGPSQRVGKLSCEIGAAYAALRPGTRITLDGGSLTAVCRLCAALEVAHIPFVRIIDKNHVEPPDSDGSEILTAIGIGPVIRRQTPQNPAKVAALARRTSHEECPVSLKR